MTSIKAISFIDADSGDEAFVGVRVERGLVGLTISLRSDGDIEVFFGGQEVEALIEALRTAHEMLSNPDAEA